MTFSRSNVGKARLRRRRNRKRLGPIWRRLLQVREVVPRVKAGLISALPAMVAIVCMAAVIAGGYFGYRFITTSPRFAVQVIEVHGNEALTTDEVLGLFGVDQGDNIFGVELAGLAERLEGEPMIESAVVRRRLPETLIVELEEREPAALVMLDGAYLADAGGRMFKRAATERGEGAGLPVITGLERDEYIADPAATQGKVRDALAFFALYQSGAGDRPELGEIHLDPRQGITFTTYEHAVAVRIGHGDPETLQRRLGAFDIAWQSLSAHEQKRTRIVYADASTRSNRITIGLQPAQPAEQ